MTIASSRAASPYRYDAIHQVRVWVPWVKHLLLWLHLARFVKQLRGLAQWSAYTGGWNSASEASSSDGYRLNLGSGQTNYRGFINIDVCPSAYVHALAAGQHLPFDSNIFDEVLCADVIEHLDYEDGLHLLAEVNRVLRIGGRLIIVTPELEEIMLSYRSRFASHPQTIQHLFGDARDHRFLYTATMLSKAIASTGLSVSRIVTHWGPIWAHVVVLAEKHDALLSMRESQTA
jgi:predicted SAM-dependent methyltransferase